MSASISSTVGQAHEALRLGNRKEAAALFERAASGGRLHEVDFGAWAELHAQDGEQEKAEGILRRGITQYPTSRTLLLRYAELQRLFDDRDGAARILQHVLKLQPDDPEALTLAGRVELERGGNPLPLFERALQTGAVTDATIGGAASALQASGLTDEAIALVGSVVYQRPDWADGLRLLARLRWERGDGFAYTDNIRELLRERPRDVQLWSLYLGILATSLSFDPVLAELPDARHRAGDQRLFDMFEAQALAETGRLAEAEPLFRRLEPIVDPGFVAVRMRALLRGGRAEDAARLGERFIRSPAAAVIWPLLGLAWRALEDPRWPWLERFDETTSAPDLELAPSELEQIAGFVRSLHQSREHPFDQSVRGGSQTIGNLLERTDAPIVRLRNVVRNAVRTYIERLPPPDPDHPFLSRHRGPFRFAGSWSVRLRSTGHHVAHVHPAGWISSALYLALPDEPQSEAKEPRAGWLGLGGAPPELGLGLEPTKWIEPKVGRLALFPSIMWHETVPFPAGERLTVAFDVVPFR